MVAARLLGAARGASRREFERVGDFVAGGPSVIYVLALLLGVVAGMRAMMAPAAVAWATHLGRLDLAGSWLNFFAHPAAVWILSGLALAELVTDQLPRTPSRRVPIQFGTRIVSGGLCGAAVAFAAGPLWLGALAGVIGAVIGTLGGSAARAALARRFGKDRPAALIEDAVAIVGALIVVALA
jgi:uncharacterized membrane protein